MSGGDKPVEDSSVEGIPGRFGRPPLLRDYLFLLAVGSLLWARIASFSSTHRDGQRRRLSGRVHYWPFILRFWGIVLGGVLLLDSLNSIKAVDDRLNQLLELGAEPT